MGKFNNPASTKTQNAEGHVAYAMDSKSKLVTMVLTSFFNESKFYGDNSVEMEHLIPQVIQQDAEFVSNLAVYARRVFNMRSVSHVLTAYLAHEPNGKPFTRKTVKGVALRGDDLTEIMSFYLATFGKPIPQSLIKGIADVLPTLDEYTLAKYAGNKKSVKMKDLIILTHPKPKDDEQADLWKRCIEGKLKTPLTWETELSANGNNAGTWEKLIDSGKVGYMALLRNLRNIINANPANIETVFQTIENPEAVKRSKQLPFRFLSAYKQIQEIAGSRILDVLENAVSASVENLPKISGTTVIAIDVSGSMRSPISRKSSIGCHEIALMLGMIANHLCENSIVYTFDTEIEKLSVPSQSGILYSALNTYVRGGGTNMGLPFEKMIADNIKADRIIILSDNMCNCGITYYNKATVQTLADEYRKKSGCDIWVHAIDLQGYGTQQFQGRKTNIVAGWSEKIFDFITLAEQGENSLVETIQKYKW
ncbi:MAG TPA: TROVE domain-containing protein [Ruminococcus sp.]|nr:TROVE domain-containing protein [Ruminococcus sp.]